MTGTLLLAVPLLLVLAILQTAVWPYFPIFGLEPQLVVLTAVAWGLLRGPEEGAIWALTGGLLLDLFSVGPFGLNAVALVIATIVAALVQHALPTSRFILPPVLGALATALFWGVQWILLSLAGWPLALGVARFLPALAVLQGVVMVPVYWAFYWLSARLNTTAVVSEGL